MFFMLLMIFEIQSVSCDNFPSVRMYESISFNSQRFYTFLVTFMSLGGKLLSSLSNRWVELHILLKNSCYVTQSELYVWLLFSRVYHRMKSTCSLMPVTENQKYDNQHINILCSFKLVLLSKNKVPSTLLSNYFKYTYISFSL